MSDELFRAANACALAGWLLLAASPLIGVWAERIASYVLPLLLAIIYTGLILAFWSRGEGDFSSLSGVMSLLAKRELALAGWIHYLAFDLFVGGWEMRTARSEAIPFLLVVPCLVLTFLFGPAGFLLFATLRTARNSTPSPATEVRESYK